MKNLILSLVIASVGPAAFAQTKYQECTSQQIQMLDNAEGEASSVVDSIIHLESPNFQCQVNQVLYAFPADCGRFTFVEYNFSIEVGGMVLNANVQDGGVSCMNLKKSVLKSVRSFSKPDQ